MHPRIWTTDDFEGMSWHDCHVHSLRLTEGAHGTGELELDLDFILEWRESRGGFSFVIVPAFLNFREVFGLRLRLDWATPTIAFGPFALKGIERRFEARERHTAVLWRLPANWPEGELEFEASGFTQRAWGQEVVSEHQVLKPAQRRGV